VDAGIWGASALLRDGSEEVGAIGVVKPLFRLDSDQRAEIIALARAAATSVRAALHRLEPHSESG